MSDKGYVNALINSLPTEQRRPLSLAFEHVMDTARIGGKGDQERATNFSWYRFDGVTSSVANTEFTVPHGLGQAPTMVIGQMLPLNSTGTQIVRLKVTRAADVHRLYLSSPDTSAAFSLLVEV